MLEYEPFAPGGEGPGFEFSPNCGSPCWVGSVWGECVSTFPTCFNVFFSFLLISSHFPDLNELFHCFFRIFLVESVPQVAVDSVCLGEEVSVGSSYITVLNWLLGILIHTSLGSWEMDNRTGLDMQQIDWGWELEKVGRIFRKRQIWLP